MSQGSEETCGGHGLRASSEKTGTFMKSNTNQRPQIKQKALHTGALPREDDRKDLPMTMGIASLLFF